ncbi:MurR/RpiR family transcriptional regulator [Albimonas sp. CAU 1670]|uniref:MurR/RpiR family transcriptional regulator n=1 Tax=Albimonas sp. CAU 1670 TaxID=3032599 RepID=UPI0023DAE130|nr:MurR/RpiR family transcriptional regulator [Albimonas sp. CAU 1670]MDF2232918.1 MurR/RpiR family transcriptional regulator [Albimonas sp. CAU 1670]
MAEVKPGGNGDPGPDASLIQRIHRIYASLPDGERRAVDLVLEGPGELALWPATELAARAGVSAPTVSRLFRRLGYASYDEARRASRALRAGGSPLYRGDEAAGGRGATAPAPDDAIARHRAAELSAIETTFARLDPRKTAAAAQRLATARRLRVAGFRNSHFVAEYARTLFSQIRPDVQMLTWAGQTPAESLGDLGADDAVLLIDLRRRTTGFLAFAEALKAAGADVVAVADPSARPPAAARWTLSCAVNTPQAFDTASGAFAVVRLLASEAMLRLGPAARRRIEKIEALHESLSDLERPVARFDD